MAFDMRVIGIRRDPRAGSRTRGCGARNVRPQRALPQVDFVALTCPLTSETQNLIDAESGDIFDETAGPGAHLAESSRKAIKFAYRRWLGFLKANYADDLSTAPAERITPERVRAFIEHLSAQIKPTSVAIAVAHLYFAARLIAPTTDWAWLRSVKSRLECLARPEDRFDRLVPPVETLDHGIELMDKALTLPPSDGHKQREIQYRDGLLLALLTIWPIRRRGLAALTVSRHLEFDDGGVNILLYPSDAKAKRAESVRVPEQLLPYLTRYLKEIRPVLVGRSGHDGLWGSFQGRPLIAGRLYDIARARIFAKFGKDMCLHDFRRGAKNPAKAAERARRAGRRSAATQAAPRLSRIGVRSSRFFAPWRISSRGQMGATPGSKGAPVRTPRRWKEWCPPRATARQSAFRLACRHDRIRRAQLQPVSPPS
jgi:integrase/recombinase XerD